MPKPGRIVSGEITLYRKVGDDDSAQIEEVKLTELEPTGPVMRNIRGDEIALVPQEPMASLSPVHTVGSQIAEAIMLHQGVDKQYGPRQDHRNARAGRLPKTQRAG